MNTFSSSAATAACLAILLATPSSAVPAPEEKAAVVTVLTESGTPMRDLTAADFVVKEGGRKLDVVEARLVPAPLSVLLLLDAAQHSRGLPPTNEVRAAVTTFVKTVFDASPDASIALWQFASGQTVVADFTSSPAQLNVAVSRLFFNQQTTAALLETLESAGEAMARRSGPRRAIVTVDFDTPDGSALGRIQPAADSITNSGATLWALSVRQQGASNPNREEVLDKMTKASGGQRYSIGSPSALEPRLKNVAASLTSQYLVTFTRTATGALKTLTFETTKGAKVLATPFMR